MYVEKQNTKIKDDYKKRCKRCDSIYRGTKFSKICPKCRIQPQKKCVKPVIDVYNTEDIMLSADNDTFVRTEDLVEWLKEVRISWMLGKSVSKLDDMVKWLKR